jgi:hypothetical protein
MRFAGEIGHRLERLYIPSAVPCSGELLWPIIRIYRCKRGHFQTGLSALAGTLSVTRSESRKLHQERGVESRESSVLLGMYLYILQEAHNTR